MSSIDDASSIKTIQDTDSLRGEINKLVIAVALTKSCKLRVIANETKLNVPRTEGPFKLRGSGISSFLNVPLPSAWGEFPVAVGRTVARSLSELAQEIRIHPEDRICGESEQTKETKSLSALELEVESAIAEPGDLLVRGDEDMVLTVALLEDGTLLRVFKSDQARIVLEGLLFLRGSLSNCEWVGGEWVPWTWAKIPSSFCIVFALWLTERAQRLLDV